MSYIHGRQIGEYIASTVDTKKEVKISKIWELYPGMFDDERLIYEKLQEEEEFEDYKRRKMAFAMHHNEQFGGEDD